MTDDGLPCPECGGTLRVTDSRKRPGSVYRRRTCQSCGIKYTTDERIIADARHQNKFSKSFEIADSLQGLTPKERGVVLAMVKLLKGKRL